MSETLKVRLKGMCFLLVLFSLVTLWYITGLSKNIDLKVYDFFCSIRTDFLTGFMLCITQLGYVWATIVISIFFLIFPINKKRYGLDIGISTGLQYLCNTYLIKNNIRRPRMTDMVLVTETSYSFPSGHTATSVIMYGFIIYLIFNNVKNAKLRTFLIAALTLLIILISVSRMYLGAHYFSDVIGAIFWGGALLIIAIIVDEIIRKKLKR